MMNYVAPERTRHKARISEAEQARRREAVEQADASNRIEGVFSNPKSKPVYDAFVRGDIEFEDILPRLQALHLHPF